MVHPTQLVTFRNLHSRFSTSTTSHGVLPIILVVPLLVVLLPHATGRKGVGRAVKKIFVAGGTIECCRQICTHHVSMSPLHSQLAQPPPGVIKIIRSKRVLQAKLAPTLLFCVVSQVHRSVSGAPQKLQTSAKPSASEPKSFKTALTWQKSARWFHDLMQEIDSKYSTYYCWWLKSFTAWHVAYGRVAAFPPITPLNFKVVFTWRVVQDFSHSEIPMFHVLDHHNDKIEGVQGNNSLSKVVQDVRHQPYDYDWSVSFCLDGIWNVPFRISLTVFGVKYQITDYREVTFKYVFRLVWLTCV